MSTVTVGPPAAHCANEPLSTQPVHQIEDGEYEMAPGNTELGLNENLEGALCYLGIWITGIVFLILEPKNKFVRFHAMQSIVTFLPLSILGWIFGGLFGITRFGFFFLTICSWIIWILVVILWLVLMLKAYKGERFKLPIVGAIAEKHG